MGGRFQCICNPFKGYFKKKTRERKREHHVFQCHCWNCYAQALVPVKHKQHTQLNHSCVCMWLYLHIHAYIYISLYQSQLRSGRAAQCLFINFIGPVTRRWELKEDPNLMLKIFRKSACGCWFSYTIQTKAKSQLKPKLLQKDFHLSLLSSYLCFSLSLSLSLSLSFSLGATCTSFPPFNVALLFMDV